MEDREKKYQKKRFATRNGKLIGTIQTLTCKDRGEKK